MGGRDLNQVVGSQIAKVVAGKLVVPNLIYNFAKEIISDLIEDKNIENGRETVLIPPYFYGLALTEAQGIYDEGTWEEWGGVIVINPFNDSSKDFYVVPRTTSTKYVFDYYLNGEIVYTYNGFNLDRTPLGFMVQLNKPNTLVVRVIANKPDNRWIRAGRYAFTAESSETGSINVNIPDIYDPPSVDVGYQWEGTIDGTSPDTNLEQLVQDIYDLLSQDDFIVSGEVTEETQPVPVDDVIEGINDLIGKQDQIIENQDVISTQIGNIEGTLEDSVGDIVDAQDATTAAVLDLTDVITEAITAPEIHEKTFDLRELFPFCIPFDIYHLLQKFDGYPAAPHVQIPFVISSIGFSYTLDLDFSAWDPVAGAMRTVELIVYALGLAWATSKVIKW